MSLEPAYGAVRVGQIQDQALRRTSRGTGVPPDLDLSPGVGVDEIALGEIPTCMIRTFLAVDRDNKRQPWSMRNYRWMELDRSNIGNRRAEANVVTGARAVPFCGNVVAGRSNVRGRRAAGRHTYGLVGKVGHDTVDELAKRGELGCRCGFEKPEVLACAAGARFLEDRYEHRRGPATPSITFAVGDIEKDPTVARPRVAHAAARVRYEVLRNPQIEPARKANPYAEVAIEGHHITIVEQSFQVRDLHAFNPDKVFQ